MNISKYPGLTTYLLTILLFTFSSCGGLKTTSYVGKPKENLSDFSALQINDFETDIAYFPEASLKEIPEQIAVDLVGGNTFKEVMYGTIENVPGNDTLVLLGEITEYRSSSDITFEGGGIKFGEVSVSVQIAIVEKDTGNEILTGEVNGFSSIGFLSDINKAIAKEIAGIVAKNY